MTNEYVKVDYSQDKEPYIETATGLKFHFLNPQPDEISILDIAHALANQCRYTGHCAQFYSVAEHSILVAHLTHPTDKKLQFAGLMHDATEAYLTDVASPVKAFLKGYKPMEDVLYSAIAAKFGLPDPLPDDVKHADRKALLIEASQLLPSGGKDWREAGMVEELPEIEIVGLTPVQARLSFLRIYEVLSGEEVLPKLAAQVRAMHKKKKEEPKLIMVGNQ